MKCKNCGQDNSDSRKYCSKCGRLLKPVCPICGFKNEEDDVFCGGCGRNLKEKAKPSVHKEEETSFKSETRGGRSVKIDPSKLLYTSEQKKTGEPKKEKEDQKPTEKLAEKRKGEQPDKAKMSQAEIERLFADKAKKEEEQLKKEKPQQAQPEGKERAKTRFVDKDSPSVLDSPITQDELDKLVEEYKKRHKK